MIPTRDDAPHLRAVPNLEVNEYHPLSEARAHLIETTDDAMECLRWLSNKTKIGFDTETTGLDHDLDHARLVQVGDAMDGWAIPFERNAMLVDDIVKRFEGEYVMHNAPFDWIMMKNGKVNIPTRKIHDTRMQAHVLSSTGSLALKTLSQLKVDANAAAAQQALNDGIGKHGGWSWENVPIDYEPYWVYGALDPVLTYRLDEIQRPQVLAEAPLSYQLELAVNWVCERMARKGARIDMEYTREFADKLSTYVVQVEKWCAENFGVKPGSSDAVAEILLRDGVELTQRTGTGRWSLDKNVLSSVQHPLAAPVLARRQAQKIVSTYLIHYLENRLGDGRTHPSINTVGGTAKNPFESGGAGRGVRTGRMSMDDPNLQNVPVRTKEGKKIRNCFIASPDCSWVKCDFDQIEMRLFAHLAEDQGLIEAFHAAARGGVDMFLGATREIFGEPTIVKADIRRQHTKNAFYAKLYGAGVERFAQTAGIYDEGGNLDLAVASAFLTRLDQLYPGIRTYQRRVEADAYARRVAEGDAYARSPLTNRKHVADEGREYALVNYVVQGTAGEILKMKMVECDQAGLGDFMILPVHDEIDLDVPKDQLDDVLVTLRDVMNDPDLLSVPITTTTSVGERWGSVEDV